MATKRFKEQNSFSKRQGDAQRICRKYPDRVPIVAEISAECRDLTIDKNKYLVPPDLTVGQLNYVLRKHCSYGDSKLTSEKALF